jgi:hypothetical protein
MNKEIAKKFVEKGLSVVAVDSKKLPLGPWKQFQSRLPEDYELDIFNDSRCSGIAIASGPSSGNIEIIDVDCKYDLTGDLFDRFIIQVSDSFPSMWEKLVIAETANNGYHVIYRAPNIEGNQKLAQRKANDEELAAKPGDRVRVLIETRGIGGYFLVQPSPGYKVIQGSLSNIPELTAEERNALMEISRFFNEIIPEQQQPREVASLSSGYHISPFDDYNSRCDVIQLLEEHGWTVGRQYGRKTLMKRPGTENKWSAEYDQDKNWFTVFSSSTMFEVLKAYKPYAVYAVLNDITDFKVLASKLIEMGYGVVNKSRDQAYTKNIFAQKASELEDIKEDFFADWDLESLNLENLVAGNIEIGLDTGYPNFDEHFRFKRGNLVIINGFDNVGKTTMILWLAMIAAVRHKWKWMLYTAENSNLSVIRELTMFYCCKPLSETNERERAEALTFIKAHFKLLSPNDMMDYDLLKKRVVKSYSSWKFDAMIIDPYNSLDDSKATNSHQFNYSVLTDIKIWGRVNDVSTWINMHAVTSAARNMDADGYVQMPNRYATEGGVKSANKADEFLTVHRITNHEDPNRRKFTMISVEKIKETITGGKPTIKNKPLLLEWSNGGSSFRAVDGLPHHPFKHMLEKMDFEEIINGDTPF